MGAWCAKRNDRNQWLQVDVRRPTRITKVTTQGRYDANQFVRNYYLYYSQNGRTFLPIKEGGKIKVWKTEVFLSNFMQYGMVKLKALKSHEVLTLTFVQRLWFLLSLVSKGFFIQIEVSIIRRNLAFQNIGVLCLERILCLNNSSSKCEY